MSRCLLVLVLGLAAFTQQAAATTPEQIQQWIRDLASREFQVRERATQKLIAGGKPVLEELEKAPANSDLEVRRRIDQVIATLRVKFPPVEIIVEAPAMPVVAGITQRIDLKVWFVNRSKRPVVVCQPVDGSFMKARDPKYQFIITDENGRQVKRLPMVGCGNVNPLRDKDFIRLEPGAKVDVFHREGSFGYFAANQFQLGNPGVYKLALSYQMQGTGTPGGIPLGNNESGVDKLLKEAHAGTLVSKPIDLKVVPQPKADSLLRMVEKKDFTRMTRQEALRALGMSADVRAVPALIAHTKHADAAVRGEAVVGLCHFKKRQVVDTLIACLSDADQNVRYRAYLGLNAFSGGLKGVGYAKPSDLQRWRQWWKENRSKFPE